MSGSNVMTEIFHASQGGEDMKVDNVIEAVSGQGVTIENVNLKDGGILAAGSAAAIGYSTGAGGAVTQQTNAATAVEINRPCGQITTVALTTAAAAEERFTVNNSLVDANDCVVLSTTYTGAGTPILSVIDVAAGSFDIVITNVHAANAFDAVMVINFAVIKGVVA